VTMDPNTTSVFVTAAEASEIMGAKLARILFVEVRRKVPWSIAAYADADLTTLFNVCESFGTGCALKTYGSRMDYVIDHSPRVAWELVTAALDPSLLTDPGSALVEIVKHTRDFRHGSSDLDPYLGAVTLDAMATERVSRRGCQSMSPYVVALAAALNVPGTTLRGYYAGTDHRSALFHATNQVLAHGDDVYFGNVPSSHLLDSYTRWATDVLSNPPYQGVASPAGYNSQKHWYEVHRLFPSEWTMSAYCGQNPSVAASGRAYLDGEFTTYATPDQLTTLEQTILAKTASCTTIPPDDPEAQLAPSPCTTCAALSYAAETPDCTTATECDDGDPCSADACVAGTCGHDAPSGVTGILCELGQLSGANPCGGADAPRLVRTIEVKAEALRRRLASGADVPGRTARGIVRMRSRVADAVRSEAITTTCGAALDDRLAAAATIAAGMR